MVSGFFLWDFCSVLLLHACLATLNLFFIFFLLAPKEDQPQNPCKPSPCGPFSNCRVTNEHAVCSCQINYVGAPPNCKPECVVSTECAQDKACINQKCADPCPGTCGQNARCQVVNHNPICSCAPSFTGDPFSRCVKEESKTFLCEFTVLCSVINLQLTYSYM